MKWIWITLALIYFLSPYDLIPGYQPSGWIDDIIVMIILFRYLSRLKQTRTPDPPPHENAQDRQDNSAAGAGGPKRPRSPYEILNVSPQADQAEIKAAYRKLANQYHPDKVAHLGKEFQELAEQRFKEIQGAYQKLGG
jgi:DnaJ domain/Protein of unknown function (DUF1232)